MRNRPTDKVPRVAPVLTALGSALAPVPAAACAACLEGAFGDRGFNVALLALMLMPFAVAGAVGGALVWLGIGRRGPDAAGGPRETDGC